MAAANERPTIPADSQAAASERTTHVTTPPTARPRALVLTVYPEAMANTRLRAAQYGPWLLEAGVVPTIWTLIDDRDVARWFDGRPRERAAVLVRSFGNLLRLPRLIRRASVVVVLREVLPFGPPVIERWAARHHPFVWDVDDAIWENYPGLFFQRVPAALRKTGAKYERLCRMATEVWAGSEVLATWCRRFSANVVVIPTVVRVAEDRPRRRSGRTVGWIGSPTTGPFVETVLPAVAAVHPAPEVLIVGADVAAPAGLAVTQRSWTPDAEENALAAIDVGLYPIDRTHPLAEGKCGLKAILYLSRGIPAVVTPTTTNASIVRDGEEGLHAETSEEWTTAVARLLDDEALWERLSVAAHRRARDAFSLERWGPTVAARLSALTRGDDA